jgi:hypothetical protein
VPPGFRPASYLLRPREFGVTPDAAWRTVPPAEQPRLAVAYLQHQMAVALRAQLGSNAPAQLARRFGGLYREDYFRRKLNGQIPFNLTEVMALVLEFGSALPSFELTERHVLPDATVIE